MAIDTSQKKKNPKRSTQSLKLKTFFLHFLKKVNSNTDLQEIKRIYTWWDNVGTSLLI